MTLSVCLIVRDEEQVLPRCLTCVKKFADEIVVVDTGSSDGTISAARQFTQNIYEFEWIDDFSAARNFAISKATCDYVMWLDADDVITDENCARIRGLVDSGGFDMAFLTYAAAFEGETPTFVYKRERIFLRSANYRFSGAVHEAVTPRGKIIYSDARIDHRKVKNGDPMRNLRIYQNLIARGISLSEREKFYYGRELYFNKMYREAAAVLEDFLQGNGWSENKIEASVNLYHCYTALGDEGKGMSSLLKALLADTPRPQICCIIGEYFMKKGATDAAIYWYKNAICRKENVNSGGFVNLDYSGFIPCLQLCVLYDRLGDFRKANVYNELAGRIKPHDECYLHNRRYLLNKLSKEVK